VHILKPDVLKILDQWLRINDVDEFKRRIYTTIRDMNTVIRNLQASISIVGQEFKWNTIDDSLKAPRIDKLIEKHKSQKYSHHQSPHNRSFDMTQKSIESFEVSSQSPKPRDPKYFMFAESPKEASKTKQAMLMGYGPVITNYCDLPNPKMTSYKNSFHLKTKKTEDKLDLDWRTSFFVGSMSPDHPEMGKHSNK
jgi:hypothetical protein